MIYGNNRRDIGTGIITTNNMNTNSKNRHIILAAVTIKRAYVKLVEFCVCFGWKHRCMALFLDVFPCTTRAGTSETGGWGVFVVGNCTINLMELILL